MYSHKRYAYINYWCGLNMFRYSEFIILQKINMQNYAKPGDIDPYSLHNKGIESL